jgi:outer membrane lipoprotein-sorting protein
MKKLSLVLLLIIAVALSGCVGNQEKQPSVGDIRASMMKAVGNVSSYSFTASQTQNETANEFGISASAANATLRTAYSEVAASVDLAGHRAEANLVTKTSIAGPGELPTVSSSNGTQYNIGNVTYTRMGAENWTQLLDPTPEGELWASGRYNAYKSRVETTNESQFEILGTEAVDGQDCYKLRLVMDNATRSETLYDAVNSAIFPFIANPNSTSIASNSSIEVLVWVDKGSFLIRRYEYTMGVTAVPDIVGIFDVSSGQMMTFNQSIKQSIKPVEISENSNSIEHYYNFNQPMSITPPKEALNSLMVSPVAVQA